MKNPVAATSAIVKRVACKLHQSDFALQTEASLACGRKILPKSPAPGWGSIVGAMTGDWIMGSASQLGEMSTIMGAFMNNLGPSLRPAAELVNPLTTGLSGVASTFAKPGKERGGTSPMAEIAMAMREMAVSKAAGAGMR